MKWKVYGLNEGQTPIELARGVNTLGVGEVLLLNSLKFSSFTVELDVDY